MDLTDDERAVLLVALHSLHLTRSEFDDEPDAIPITRITPEAIRALVSKLGGDPDVLFFGARILDPSSEEPEP